MLFQDRILRQKQVENFAGSFCDKYSSINIASELLLAEELLKEPLYKRWVIYYN